MDRESYKHSLDLLHHLNLRTSRHGPCVIHELKAGERHLQRRVAEGDTGPRMEGTATEEIHHGTGVQTARPSLRRRPVPARDLQRTRTLGVGRTSEARKTRVTGRVPTGSEGRVPVGVVPVHAPFRRSAAPSETTPRTDTGVTPTVPPRRTRT